VISVFVLVPAWSGLRCCHWSRCWCGAVGGSISAGKNHQSLGGESNSDRESEIKFQAAIATVFLLFPQKPIMLSGTKTRSTSAIASTSFATGTAVASRICPASNGAIHTSLSTIGSPPSAGLTFTKHCRRDVQVGFNLASSFILAFDACIELCASLNCITRTKIAWPQLT
jgi:hypothetical protein